MYDDITPLRIIISLQLVKSFINYNVKKFYLIQRENYLSFLIDLTVRNLTNIFNKT